MREVVVRRLPQSLVPEPTSAAESEIAAVELAVASKER
jgi:hypothetical protein